MDADNGFNRAMIPETRTESHFNKSPALTPSSARKLSSHTSPWNFIFGNFPSGVRTWTSPNMPKFADARRRLTCDSRYGSSVFKLRLAKSRCTSAANGEKQVVLATWIWPLVFQRTETVAVMLVLAWLEIFLTMTLI